jgi:ribose 5-phosphate isomerase B
MSKIISIGCDHAGTDYKTSLIQHLEAQGYTVINRGTNSHDSVDYPDYAHPVANDVETGAAHLGILICGSANGVAITANKHQGIRAALCWTNEVAALARQHNDANIICLPARFISIEDASTLTDTFLNTPFEGGRHANRVNKIACA